MSKNRNNHQQMHWTRNINRNSRLNPISKYLFFSILLTKTETNGDWFKSIIFEWNPFFNVCIKLPISNEIHVELHLHNLTEILLVTGHISTKKIVFFSLSINSVYSCFEQNSAKKLYPRNHSLTNFTKISPSQE